MPSSEEGFHQLLSLPEHLLFNVFMKINNLSLIKIRRTCRFIDNFAEKCRKPLSSRLEMGIELIVHFKTKWMDRRGKIIVESQARFEDHRKRTGFFTLDLEKSLSAIPVRESRVLIEPEPRFYEEAMKQLKRLKLRCLRSYWLGKPTEWLVKVTNLVEIRNEIRIFTTQHENDNEKVLMLLNQESCVKKSPKILEIQMKDRTKIDTFMSRPHIPELFHLVKHFKRFESNCSISECQRFLWDAFRSTEEFELQSFDNQLFDTAEDNTPVQLNPGLRFSSLPPLEVLWQLSPEEQQQNWSSCNSGISKHIPLCVRRIELTFKHALLVEMRYVTQTIMNVYFLEKNINKIFEKLVELLGLENFGDERREEYWNAGETRRREILRESCRSWKYIASDVVGRSQ